MMSDNSDCDGGSLETNSSPTPYAEKVDQKSDDVAKLIVISKNR